MQQEQQELTINGVPASKLSDSGKRLLDKVMKLKQEANELQKNLIQKQAAQEELSQMLLEEVNEIKAAEEAPAMPEEAGEFPEPIE